jgi:hypothetical protein
LTGKTFVLAAFVVYRVFIFIGYGKKLPYRFKQNISKLGGIMDEGGRE